MGASDHAKPGFAIPPDVPTTSFPLSSTTRFVSGPPGASVCVLTENLLDLALGSTMLSPTAAVNRVGSSLLRLTPVASLSRSAAVVCGPSLAS